MQAPGIQSALLEIDDRRREAQLVARRREMQVEGRAELERIIAEVEEANLSGAPHSPDLRVRLRGLNRQLDVAAPRSVWLASTGARLHDALMDWEDALLECVAPHRLDYADRHEAQREHASRSGARVRVRR